MIPLDDLIWSELHCHNITGHEFAAILASYYAGEIPAGEELQEDLLQCICGGDVYDSSIAAAPHLIRLASRCDPPSAAAMLEFAARAIAEAKKDDTQFDQRLTGPLREASGAGVIEVMRVLESPELDTFARDEMEAALMAFSADFEGYWEAQARIDEWWDAWSDQQSKTIERPAPSVQVVVIGGLEAPSSQTFSGGE